MLRELNNYEPSVMMHVIHMSKLAATLSTPQHPGTHVAICYDENNSAREKRYIAVAWDFHIRNKFNSQHKPKRAAKDAPPPRDHHSYCPCKGVWEKCCDNPHNYDCWPEG